LAGSGLALLYTVFHCVWVYQWYSKSNETFAYLSKLDYMEKDDYAGQLIRPRMAIMFAAMHFIAVAVAITYINHLPDAGMEN
jgi:ABC-type Fe3+ transport system permease subunit